MKNAFSGNYSKGCLNQIIGQPISIKKIQALKEINQMLSELSKQHKNKKTNCNTSQNIEKHHQKNPTTLCLNYQKTEDKEFNPLKLMEDSHTLMLKEELRKFRTNIESKFLNSITNRNYAFPRLNCDSKQVYNEDQNGHNYCKIIR